MTRSYFYLFCFSVATLLFTSCGSDDDITGTYKIISYSLNSCDDSSENFTLDVSSDDGCSTLLGEEVCGNGTVVLNEGGTFSVSFTFTIAGSSETIEGTGAYTLDGNTLTICDGTDCVDGTVDGKRLTISLPEDDGCRLTMTGEK